MIDPYKVLGVSRNASEEEIKKAYRQKAKEYHPDLHPGDAEAARKMNEVNEAYDMLKNPEKYERKRAQEQAQQAYRQQNTYGGYSSNNYGSGYSSGGYGNSSYGGYSNHTSGSNGYNQQSGGYGSYGPFGFYGFNFDDLFGGYSRGSQYQARPTANPGDPPELVRAINSISAGRYQEAVYILSQMTSAYRNARWYYVSAVAYQGMGDYTQAYNQIQKAVQMEPQNSMYQQLMRQYAQYNRSEGTGRSTSRTGFSAIRIIGIVILLFFIMRLLFGCMSYRMFFF